MKSKLLILIFSLTIGFIACSDDEKDNTKPVQTEKDSVYVGEWQSRIYPVYSATFDTLKWERMTFTFVNDEFTDIVEQSLGKEDMNVAEAVRFKGDIEPTNTTMDVDVNKISIGGDQFIDINESETDFNNAWALTLEPLLDPSFTAEYKVVADGDSLNLTLPTKMGDVVLKLKKQ